MNALSSPAPVLLVGPAAEAMAPRLALSGYRPLTESDLIADAMGNRQGDPAPVPEAVILSPGYGARIADLRRQGGGAPLLLGISADSVAARSLCLTSGADDFWLTGMAPSDLLTRLRLHLNLRPDTERPTRHLQVGDLQVDPDRRRVRRGTRLIALTGREYQLLLLLLQRCGEVVGRQSILTAIWPDQVGSHSNVIDVYVRYLRRKLEAEGEPRLVHTIRGVGYCLQEGAPPSGGIGT